MVRERLDVPGLRQVGELRGDGGPDLLAAVSVDLAESTQRLGMPVDRVHEPTISNQYVLSTGWNVVDHGADSRVPLPAARTLRRNRPEEGRG